MNHNEYVSLNLNVCVFVKLPRSSTSISVLVLQSHVVSLSRLSTVLGSSFRRLSFEKVSSKVSSCHVAHDRCVSVFDILRVSIVSFLMQIEKNLMKIESFSMKI